MALTKVRGSGLGTLGDGTANDVKILFDGNAVDYHIGLDDSADTLNIGKGSTLGTTTAMTFDTNGIITKPLQPAFYATGGANNNIAVDGNRNFLEGSGSVAYDINSDTVLSDNVSFSPGDVRYFVAPVTGQYIFTFRVRLDDIATDQTYIWLYLRTAARNYTMAMFDPDAFDSSPAYWALQGTVIADMDANDTAYPLIYIAGGSSTTDADSYEFSGQLIG